MNEVMMNQIAQKQMAQQLQGVGMAIGGCDAQRQPQVKGALERLYMDVQEIAKLAELLEQRCGSILAPCPPMPECAAGGNKVPREAKAPLAEAIDEITAQASATKRRLADLLQRIET